ncbi:MAG: hypothetical protein ACRDJ3_00480 [Solirubrobacteraceae bacterium]
MIAEQEQTRIALRVPASLVTALESVAEREERTLSAEIRLLMRRRVEAAGIDLNESGGGQ